MNILLIDDDPDTNFLIDILLKKTPFVDEYYIQPRAKDALNFLRVYDKPLSCIFVDIKMPEMDGFEFMEQYEQKLSHKFPSTQVFFLTSSVRQSDKDRALEFSSVKDFIIKPLSKKKLFDIQEDLKN